MKNISTLPITYSVNSEISDNDTRFINVTIDVLHTGLNLNGSVFNKDVVDSCVESIKNTPILGFIRELPNGEKDFKGHEYVLTKSDENGVKKKYIGNAFGTIPESCNPRWITKQCDDGVTRDFLQVDALIWTKFEDGKNILLEDVVKPESMELNPDSIEGYEDDNENFVFTKFKFEGCCMLGSDIEPAMTGANIEVNFTISDFINEIKKEITNKYSIYTELVNKNINEGGNETMPDNNDFALSIMQQFENIAAIVNQQEMFTDRWGDEISRYSLVDIQGEEIIVVDRQDNYNYYGFSFTMSGDSPVIDFKCGNRKKISYENYEGELTTQENAFNFDSEINEIKEKAFTKIEEANQKIIEAELKLNEAEGNYTNIKTELDSVKAEYDTIKTRYDEYVAEDNVRKEAEEKSQKQAEFAKYENALSANEEFVALKENIDELTLEDVSVKCAMLYAKVNLSIANSNFSRSQKDLRIGIADDTDDVNNYISTKYGNIPVNK